MSTFDVFVIGAGVAGLTAAELAARRGLSVCVAEELMFGGLVLNVNHLQPGLEGLPASGSELGAGLMESIANLGVETLFEPVTGVARSPDGTLQIAMGGETHSARCVVVASGARLRRLGVPGEEEFEGKGVAHCADCDAPMYHGEVAVVVGGGDSALQEALVLAEFCSTVHLVHRRSSFTARAEFVDAVRNAPCIQVHFDTVVEAIVGDGQVTGVRVRQGAPGASGESRELHCKGIFAYVGLEPNTSFLPASIAMEGGAIRVSGELESTLANVYAVGAVRAGYAGQLTDGVQDATTAVDALCRRLGRG